MLLIAVRWSRSVACCGAGCSTRRASRPPRRRCAPPGLAGPPLREGLTTRFRRAGAALLAGAAGNARRRPVRTGRHRARRAGAGRRITPRRSLETVVVAMRADRRQLASCPPCGKPGCQVGRAVIAPLGAGAGAGPGWRVRRCAGRPRRVTGRPVSRPGHRRNRPVHHHPTRTGRPGRFPGRPGQGGGAGAARADLPALHLQRAHHHCRIRPQRSRSGARVVAGVRRFHPLLVPAGRGIHHAGRRNGQHREVPDAGTGPVRRAAADPLAGGARGARRCRAIPVHPAADRERGPARPGRPSWRGDRVRHRRGRRAGLRDQRGGRRDRDGPRVGRPARRSTIRPAVTSGWSTWTTGCGPRSARTTG